MDGRLIFLHPYACDVVTDQISGTGYRIPGQALWPSCRQIRTARRGVSASEWAT